MTTFQHKNLTITDDAPEEGSLVFSIGDSKVVLPPDEVQDLIRNYLAADLVDLNFKLAAQVSNSSERLQSAVVELLSHGYNQAVDNLVTDTTENFSAKASSPYVREDNFDGIL